MTTELKTAFGERLVKLADGRPGLRAALAVEAKGEEGRPVIRFVASDETLDRYDEIIQASGWDLEDYEKNPVFLNAHMYWDIEFVLGKSIEHRVEGDKLIQVVEFAVDINPAAKMAFELFKGRFMNAVSVGFIPITWETGSNEAGFRRKFTKQSLLELSAVPVPANPNAVQDALKEGAIDKSTLREVADQLRRALETLSENEAPAGDASSAAARGDSERSLVRELKHLRELIRA